ncbi:peptidyl-prolyl cis-trans isomerase [Candidatus Woesearchaeota archaeon]|nr:peptidyl-prolyl cis-trans isomerase [Candidatus Woesearchaeota archaeon]
MPVKINASHILVKTLDEANEVLRELDAGKPFEKVAKEKSSCPSKKKGGNLGWFTKGKMVREFEKVAFSMKKDQVSEPVKTKFGWHIIKVNDTYG